MKNLYKLLISTLFIATFGFGQTEVSGTISSNTTWTVSGSPYTITASTALMDSATLTIEAGVTILFSQDALLKMMSGTTLIAQGTENDSIYFTVTDTNTVSNTNGIQFDNNSIPSETINDTTYISGSIFDYCVFNYMTTTGNGGAIENSSGLLLIKHSKFYKNNASNGGAIIGHKFIIHRSTFIENNAVESGGALKTGVHGSKIYFTIFKRNTSKSNGGAIYSGGGSPNIGMELFGCSFIENSTVGSNIYNGYGGAIFTHEWGTPVVVRDCVFMNNQSALDGGAFYGRQTQNGRPPHKFFNTVFIGNISNRGGGAAASIFQRLEFYGCRFYLNNANTIGSAIRLTETQAPSIVDNCIFYNNYSNNPSDGFLIHMTNYFNSDPLNFNNSYVVNNDTTSAYLIKANYFQGNNNSFIANYSKIVYFNSGSNQSFDLSNNYWGTKSSTVIDSLIYDFYDDPNFNTPIADYTPFLMGPSPDVAGSPSSISSLLIKIDSLYQTTLADSISAGDTVYVDISGVDSDTLSKGLASVWVINLTLMDTVTKTLIETSETSGNYRGAVYTAESTDNINDVIQGEDGEILKVVSVNDPTVYTYVFIGFLNSPPVAGNILVSMVEDTDYDGTLPASDVDGGALTFSIIDSTVNGTLTLSDPATGTFFYSPIENFNGSDSLTFSVSDGMLSDTGKVSITVATVNDAPTSFTLNEQDSVYITMDNFASDSIVFTWDESSDVDEDELTYHFTAELIINGQLTTEYDTTLTNNVMKIDYQSVFDEIYAAQAMLAAIEWDVSVSDGVEEVMAENGSLTVGINASDAVLSINEEFIPTEFVLHQNYPNPFNPITTLRYDLPEQSMVNIIIYDLLGRQVRTLINQTQDAGFKSVIWNATNDFGKPVSAGVYLYQIRAGEFVQTRKMVLLK